MGPLVEQFPLHVPTTKDGVQHNKFLIKQMKNCAYDNDKNNKNKKDIAELLRQINQSNSQFNPWSC
jgi:hypothetical protein